MLSYRVKLCCNDMAQPHNPVYSAEFKSRQVPALYPDDPLSKKPIPTRFRGSVDKRLRSIPEYTTLIRDAVDQFFQRLDGGDTTAPVQYESTEFQKVYLRDFPLPEEVATVWNRLTRKEKNDLAQSGVIREMKARGLYDRTMDR
jgi:hypothetical protein